MNDNDYAEKTIELPVWRFETLLKKEHVYDFERAKLLRSSYRSEDDCIMYDVPTVEEEMEFKAALEEIKSIGDTNSKKGEE